MPGRVLEIECRVTLFLQTGGTIEAAVRSCCYSWVVLGTEPIERPAFSTATGGPALLLGAGDIARCGADGTPSTTNKSREASDLLLARPGIPVFVAGDNACYDGTLTQYRNCYAPTWGRVKSRTLFPTPGNHEYHTVNAAGQTVQAAGAPGYFDYFNGAGADAGVAGKRWAGYYARDYGGARIYGLNCELTATARTAMVNWVKADLRANPRACQIAIIHRPFFNTAGATGHRINLPAAASGCPGCRRRGASDLGAQSPVRAVHPEAGRRNP